MAAGRQKKGGSETGTLMQFDDRESRLTFIQERLDNLLDEFGSSYGRFLADELQKRLDHCIQVFHEEASGLLDDMAAKSGARMEMSDEMRRGKSLEELVPNARGRRHAPASPVAADGEKNLGTDRVGMPKSLFQTKKEI